MVERLPRVSEQTVRRRTVASGTFENRSAVCRLIGAVLAEQHDEWAFGRRYMTPVPPREASTTGADSGATGRPVSDTNCMKHAYIT